MRQVSGTHFARILGGIILASIGLAICVWLIVSVGPGVIDDLRGGPHCEQGITKPVSIEAAIEALEAEGYVITNPARASQCGGNTQAQLRDSTDIRDLNCLVNRTPVVESSLVTLPDTGAGGINMALANVQCIVYVDEELRDGERDRIARALKPMYPAQSQ